MNGSEWTQEYRETGERDSIFDEIMRLGGENLYYQPYTDPRLMNALGYQGNHNSAYATTFGSNGAYGNFTPIQYDSEADELIKVWARDELEKYANDVMSGKRQDDMGLRLDGNYATYDDALYDAIKTNYLKKVQNSSNERQIKRELQAQEQQKYDNPNYVDDGVARGSYEVIQKPQTMPRVEQKTPQEGINYLNNLAQYKIM